MTTSGRHRDHRSGAARPTTAANTAALHARPVPTHPTAAGQRWLARLSLAAAALGVVVLLLFEGITSLGLLVFGAAGAAVALAGLWLALTRRGVLRLLALALAIAAPVAIIVGCLRAGLGWALVLTVALVLVSITAGQAALGRDRWQAPMPEHEAAPPRQPWIVLNPRAGGGKVASFGLAAKAKALGATVVVLDGRGTVDVAELARQAIAEGADLLGVAGGDGTQALVAGCAAEHDLPLLVIAAGTRNHFALDLGLDRDDPARCLDALTDGVELHVDLGFIDDRPFVNTASFGAYANVVEREDYRKDKINTAVDVLPEILAHRDGAHLRARAGEVVINGPHALLVSNNPYGAGDLAGLGRRARLDSGLIGVIALTIDSAAQAAGLLRGRHARGLDVLCAREAVVESEEPTIPVGIDGEALWLPTPVRCSVRGGALRVRVPRTRPGVPPQTPRMNWNRLRALALAAPWTANRDTTPTSKAARAAR